MGEGQPTISTHVLDTEGGRPAAGVSVRLLRVGGAAPQLVGHGTSDEDGRIRRLLQVALEPGEYRIEFELEAPFFRALAVSFRVADTTRSYHVPLLLAPYGMTTYLGS